MRIVAFEEHISLPDMVNRIRLAVRAHAGWPTISGPESPVHVQQAKLEEIGPLRLRLMDEASITVQVLSVSGPGAELLSPPRAPPSPANTTTAWLGPSRLIPTASPASRTCPPRFPPPRPASWAAPWKPTTSAGPC